MHVSALQLSVDSESLLHYIGCLACQCFVSLLIVHHPHRLPYVALANARTIRELESIAFALMTAACSITYFVDANLQMGV